MHCKKQIPLLCLLQAQLPGGLEAAEHHHDICVLAYVRYAQLTHLGTPVRLL